MMNIVETLNRRYSTKEFNPEKKISDADMEAVKSLLRLSPSSTNIQPWHFIIADSQQGKARIARGAQDFYLFNESKIMNASHVIVLCARTSAEEEYMQRVLEQEDQDGRYANPEVKQMVYNPRNHFADIHRNDLNDFQHWVEKQVYLSMGSLLMGAASIGLDALPMEGVDVNIINDEFGLSEQGFTSVAVVALGYRDASDFNAALPKSRLPESEVFTFLS